MSGTRSLLWLILLLSAPGFALLSCEGERQEKVYRIGILSGLEIFDDIAVGFKNKMTELGYREGKDILYSVRKIDPDFKKGHNADTFYLTNLDLIFAFPTGPALAAKAAVRGTKIPVVFAMAGIEGNNLIESLHKPGGKISGVRFPGPETTGKRLEILHELKPDIKRVLITYDPGYPTIPTALKELESVASLLGVTLVKEPVHDFHGLQAAFQKRTGSGDMDVDAILIMPEFLTQLPESWALITEFAAGHGLPIAGALNDTAYKGAIFTYAPDLIETGGLAASIADKIFKGTPAGEIMVVTPKSRLCFNYGTAVKMGIKVSEGFLNLADKIIR